MHKLFLSLAVILSLCFCGCRSEEEQKNQDSMPPRDTSKGESVMANDSLKDAMVYVCPCGGCPEVKEPKPGKCPKCDLDLVKEKK